MDPFKKLSREELFKKLHADLKQEMIRAQSKIKTSEKNLVNLMNTIEERLTEEK